MFDTCSEVIQTTLPYYNRHDPTNKSFLDATTYKPDPNNYIDVIAPLPVFDAAFVDQIASVGFQVSNMIGEILDAVFSGSVDAMLEWQGMPSDLRALVAQDSDERGLLLGQFFSRPDLIVGPDGPRVLEVNFGPSNGGLALVDAIQARFSETEQGKRLAQQGVALRPSQSMKILAQALGRILRRAVPNSARNHLLVAVTTAGEVENPKGHIADFCNGLVEAGYRVTLAQLSELVVQDDSVQYGPERVDAVYCMCTFAEMQRAEVPHRLLRDLIRLDRAAELDFVGGPAHLVFDSKTNLALLHDPIADPCFDPARLAFIRQHIAPTCLTRDRSRLKRRAIYKPVNEFGGFGITFDPHELAEVSSEYIAQEIVPNACLWVDERGEQTRHLCFGTSLVGGNHASALIRAKTADGDVPIINAAQGAAVGPVLVRERE